MRRAPSASWISRGKPVPIVAASMHNVAMKNRHPGTQGNERHVEMRVGVRELKDSLSSYLRRARAGDHIVVTDRGQPVARLVPPDLPAPLIEMIREGRLIPPRQRTTRLPRPVLPYKPGSRLLSDIVIEQRK